MKLHRYALASLTAVLWNASSLHSMTTPESCSRLKQNEIATFLKEAIHPTKIATTPALIKSIKLSRDGKFVVTKLSNDESSLWNTETGEHLKDLGQNSRVKFNPRHPTLAFTSNHKQEITMINLESLQAIGTGDKSLWGDDYYPHPEYRSRVSDFDFSPDDDMLAIAAAKKITLCGASDGLTMSDKLGIGNEDQLLEKITFSPDGKKLACILLLTGRSRAIKLYNLETKKLIDIPKTYTSYPKITFSPDSTLLAITTVFSEPIELRNVESPETRIELNPNPTGRVIAFSPDSKKFISKSDGIQSNVYSTTDFKPIGTLNPYDYIHGFLTFNPAGNLVLSQDNSKISVFDAQTYEPIATLADTYYGPIALNIDGNKIVYAINNVIYQIDFNHFQELLTKLNNSPFTFEALALLGTFAQKEIAKTKPSLCEKGYKAAQNYGAALSLFCNRTLNNLHKKTQACCRRSKQILESIE